MTVEQALKRIRRERLEGINADAWTLAGADVDELQADVLENFTTVEAQDDITAALKKKRPGYAMTFRGIDIYRAS